MKTDRKKNCKAPRNSNIIFFTRMMQGSVNDSRTCCFRVSFMLTLRRLMSYIYGAPFLMFLDHTQRRSTVGRTPLDE